jgi:hypothetical protein
MVEIKEREIQVQRDIQMYKKEGHLVESRIVLSQKKEQQDLPQLSTDRKRQKRHF